MRRILLFCLPGDYSGVPRYVEMLAKHFARTDHVAIVTTDFDGPFGDLKESHPEIEIFLSNGIENSFSLKNFLFCIKQIRHFVASYDPDIIHLNGSLFGLAGRLARTPGRRKIFTYHGLPFGDGRGVAKNIFLFGVEVLAANWSRCEHVFISRKDMRSVARFKIRKHELHYIPNGIALARELGKAEAEPKESDKIKVVSVAKNRPQKRQDRLIGAFSLLGDNFTLTIVGEDTDNGEMTALADRRLRPDIRQNLTLAGVTRFVGDYLRQAEIFVLSSDYEGMPLSAIEALSEGLFIVMPDVGGAEEICVEGVGLIYSPNTEQQLARALAQAAETVRAEGWSPDIPKAHYTANFTRERLLERMKALYDGHASEYYL